MRRPFALAAVLLIAACGQKTPTGSDLYAKLGDQKKVFLISSFLDSSFNKTTFDLRDKTVLKLDQAKVDALQVTRGADTLKVAKKEGEWQVEQPIASLAATDAAATNARVARTTPSRIRVSSAVRVIAAGSTLRPRCIISPLGSRWRWNTTSTVWR